MTLIERLKNIDLAEIPKAYAELRSGLQELLQDYEKEEDKAVFEEEAAENISAYLELVAQVAPAALDNDAQSKKVKPKIEGKNRAIVLDYHNRMLDLVIDFEAEADEALKTMVEEAVAPLGKVIEEEKDDKAIPEAVMIALEPLYTLAEMTEEERGGPKELPKAFMTTVASLTSVANALLHALGRKPPKTANLEDRSSSTTSMATGKTKQTAKGKKETNRSKKTKGKDQGPNTKKKDPPNPEQKEAQAAIPLSEKIKRYEQDIEACRAVMREYRRKRREAQPKKPTPTRRTLLKKKALALVQLTPEALANDPHVQAENQKIVKTTVRAFMKNWGMTNTRPVEKDIDQEFDRNEEKREEKAQQDRARQWRRDLPATSTIIAHEKKHNKPLLEDAAEQIVKDLTAAVALYKNDPKQAFRLLRKKLDDEQRKAYLPAYILEEMKARSKNKK